VVKTIREQDDKGNVEKQGPKKWSREKKTLVIGSVLLVLGIVLILLSLYATTETNVMFIPGNRGQLIPHFYTTTEYPYGFLSIPGILSIVIGLLAICIAVIAIRKSKR
jgi:1,4-dihydroxy-2-naphthoate octaprenyltransferase